MNLVLETLNLQTAYKEKRDWEHLGYNVTVKEKRKIFKGGYQRVYRVWVSKKIGRKR